MTFLHLNSCAVCRTLSLMRTLSRRKVSYGMSGWIWEDQATIWNESTLYFMFLNRPPTVRGAKHQACSVSMRCGDTYRGRRGG